MHALGGCYKTARDSTERNSRLNGWAWQNTSFLWESSHKGKGDNKGVCLWQLVDTGMISIYMLFIMYANFLIFNIFSSLRILSVILSQ